MLKMLHTRLDDCALLLFCYLGLEEELQLSLPKMLKLSMQKWYGLLRRHFLSKQNEHRNLEDTNA